MPLSDSTRWRENETNPKLCHNTSEPRMKREQITGVSENKSEVEMLVRTHFPSSDYFHQEDICMFFSSLDTSRG